VAKPAPLSQEDVERYGDVLAQIKGRVEYAVGILDNVSDLFDLESAALQLRKAIELVALATFAVNRQNIEGITTALHKSAGTTPKSSCDASILTTGLFRSSPSLTRAAGLRSTRSKNPS
jgi:hypothetical protein